MAANRGIDIERIIEAGKVTVTGAVIVAHEMHTERKFMGRKNTYVRFRIQVTGRLQNETVEWTVERRWSEFKALRKTLNKKRKWPEQVYKKHLKGHGWSDGTSHDEIELRKKGFTLILAALKPYFADEDVITFLCHDSRTR